MTMFNISDGKNNISNGKSPLSFATTPYPQRHSVAFFPDPLVSK